MKGKSAIDPSLHWVDHYVEYGFAVCEGLLEREFIDDALEAVVRMVGSELPMEEWTVENLWPHFGNLIVAGRREDGSLIDPASPEAILSGVFDQPRLRGAINELFEPRYTINEDRAFQLFVKPRDPHAKKALPKVGHIDFTRDEPPPVLGSGFMFQTTLVDKEPFGGNILIWPGSHKHVSRHVVADPAWAYPKDWGDIPEIEPFEFVGEACDVLFFSHLVAHDGSLCTTPMPRVSLHCQVLCDEWLTEIDPEAPGLSAWERSLAHAGPFHIREDEARKREAYLKRHAMAASE